MKKILSVFLCLLLLCSLSACAGEDSNGWHHRVEDSFCGLACTGSLTLDYARKFAVDYYEGGYSLLSIASGDQFLVVPEGAKVPDTKVPVIQQPIKNIYLAASSAMCLFDALDSLDAISLSGTRVESWTVENARLAMENGSIVYAGKYNEPDYELILSSGCPLSVQSTMINHSPEVKEKIEELGIPVLVDYSSYEPHPLGRTEWIKLYAAILGREEAAETCFREQEARLENVVSQENTGKTVAFFYISASGGHAVVRKSGDYVTKMIALAGGQYMYKDLGDPETATATVSLTMEEFYTSAVDADIVIYNSTIDGQLRDLADFLSLNELLKDLKAVREENVWCTNANLYQDMTRLGTVTEEMHAIFTGTAEDEMDFLYRLK